MILLRDFQSYSIYSICMMKKKQITGASSHCILPLGEKQSPFVEITPENDNSQSFDLYFHFHLPSSGTVLSPPWALVTAAKRLRTESIVASCI